MVRGDGGVLYGQPDRHGWTSEDATFQPAACWSVTDVVRRRTPLRERSS